METGSTKISIVSKGRLNMTRKEMKQRAKTCLGSQIFAGKWLIALVFVLLVSAISSTASAITFGIASLLLTGPLSFGLCFVFLKQARDGKEMSFADLFKGFTANFGDNFLIALMTSIYIFLWSLLFIIPGIIKYYAYSMSYYVKADHPEMDWSECIKTSRMLMKGHKFKLFVLQLSFIGWYIVGMLCLGIGVLWVDAYYRATEAQFYDSICGRTEKEQTEPAEQTA